MNFILREERELLETVVSLGVPFSVESVEVENSTIVNYKFTSYESKDELTFTAITNRGMVSYDFDEELLHEVKVWMNGGETSNSFNDYVEYTKCFKIT